MRYLLVLLYFAVSLVNGFRLRQEVRPISYELSITTHFGEEDNKFNFEGRVKIMVSCVRPVAFIELHSKDLEIKDDQVTIRNANDSEVNDEVSIQWTSHTKEDDIFTIYLWSHLKKGHLYEINIPYGGIINNGLEGFYRRKYHDSKTNKTKWLGVTQFQPINARRAFPCFDEPEFKATFDISIARRDGYTSISNMPLINTEPMENKTGWFWDQFAISKPMSTYLVAWLVFDDDFQAKESINELNNVTFKIWCRKDGLDRVTFASEVGPKLLHFFENYFGIDYPLPKLDLVAIPDFLRGGMENWGLITFREKVLLYDPNVSTKSDQRQVAHVMAHELAHQWFGNLVTMNWWTDIWLNEGFATYMAAIAVHHLFPEWNFLEEDHVYSMLDVFSADSLTFLHPVHAPIGDPMEISQVFDKITYKKGSCLLRMMSMFLGEKTFKSGVINYLNQHKYQNVHQDDLFESLTEAAHNENTLPGNFTVKEIMDTWTLQSGFPVISVKRNYENGSAEITQKLFLTDNGKLNIKQQCWWVPLTYSTKSKPHFNITTPKYWLNCDTAKNVTIKNIANKDDWVVFNNKMSGVYKVNYDKENWHMLANALKENYTQIPALNRALLFSDAAAFVRIGDLPYDVFFDLLGYLEHETEYLLLNLAFDQIEELKDQMKLDSKYELFADYMKALLTPMYQKVGGVVVRPEDKENADKIKMQIRIVELSYRYKVQKCLNDVKNLFKEYMKHPNEPNPIPEGLTFIVYCIAINRGGVKEWDFLWNKYLNSNVTSEKLNIMEVLASCPRKAWLFERYLDWSLDAAKIPKQEVASVFNWVASSDFGYPIAKKFFYKNIDQLAEYLKEKSSLNLYASALRDNLHDQEDVDEFVKFIKKHDNIFTDITKIL